MEKPQFITVTSFLNRVNKKRQEILMEVAEYLLNQ